ncbi:VWA domain-containing protein [Desulfosediminicola flagellatus]|uniref:VWA domain-containing protein n=1 Tax=Desulfosediminicola flagellatus TaxID=2569541 RepID=UPI0010AD60F8|nr:VWA domain-containing protein [Desulfosediminicola flagellatus]
MQFAQPIWIFTGLIVSIVLLVLLHILQKNRQKSLERFAASQLLGRLTRHISPGRRRFKHAIIILAVMLLFVALARPQYGFKWVEVKRKGIDILFALDTSKSMLATDIKPNRLQRARFGIMDFVNQLEGDRIGLMPFAGSGYLMCPMTLDYDAFIQSLNSITTDIIPKGGTNISAVIEEAEKVLDNDTNHKILILLTDGENLQGDALKAAEKAHDNGMTIYTVGVGTPGGELIPIDGKSGSGSFVKNSEGKYVTSKLDESTLTKIAETTEGLYVPLGNSGEGLEKIYQQKLTLIPKEELSEKRHKVPLERFSWPLAAAIFLLLLEFGIPERRSNKQLSFPGFLKAGRKMKKHFIPMILAGIFSLQGVHDIHASEAEDAYADENYLKASELYQERLKQQPDNQALHYNYGTAVYKNNLYDEAIASFNQALKGEDLSIQSKAYFNRGNAHFQKGVESQQADPQSTIEQWEQAIKSFEGTLKLTPNDTQAAENTTFVKQKLEELKQQMEQQQEQDKQDKQDNKQDQQDKQDKQDQKSDQPEGDDEKKQDSGQDRNNDNSDQQQPEKREEDSAKNSENQDKKEQSAEKEQPQASQQDTQQEGNPADQEAENQRAMERREAGKMTEEEAKNLLNALKNEEGELNFIPGGSETVEKDW